MGCKNSKTTTASTKITPHTPTTEEEFNRKHHIKPLPGNLTAEADGKIKIIRGSFDSATVDTANDSFHVNQHSHHSQESALTKIIKKQISNTMSAMGSGRFKKSTPVEYQVEEKLGKEASNFSPLCEF